jgi:hypothetical protein
LQEAADIYRIVGENPDPTDEHWQFDTATRVRCVRKWLNGKNVLVAVEQVT